MANGGLRGIQVTTNTGHDISTSYYFNNDQTTATTAIQYAWNPPASPSHQWVPPVRDGTVQTLLGIDTPTPGYAAPGQVPAGLVTTPAENDAPVITDLTGGSAIGRTSCRERVCQYVYISAAAVPLTQKHQQKTTRHTRTTRAPTSQP